MHPVTPNVPPLIPKTINPLHQMRVMGRFVRRAVKKPGAAPGTLVHTGVKKVERIRIHYLDYDAEQLSEAELGSIEECAPFKESPTVSWINVDGLHDVDLIQELGERFSWHPLMLEDIVAVGQRPKIEEYDTYVFMVLPMLSWDVERRQVVDEQLSLVLGERYVFTFQERTGDVFEGVRERLRNARGRIRSRGADYLAYALADAVVDHYFHVLEGIGDVAEELEGQLLESPSRSTMHRLHALKRELISVRRQVWPLREMLATLVRSGEEYFTEETQIFMRDVHDHAVQVAETVETLRDVVSGGIDLYLSNVGYRTNEVMKVLTIMASIFIPLTFLAGLYGMNFDNMPELHMRWAYPTLLLVMLVLGLGMVVYFRRKGWL
jgi:magnesium transporter